MIYDDVVTALKIDPGKRFTFPPTAAFSLQGYKARKRLAGDASRVLREAGFSAKNGVTA